MKIVKGISIFILCLALIGLGFFFLPCMKSRRYILTGIYADILRQIHTKLSQNLLCRHCAVTVKVRNLAQSMRAGIRSSASTNLNLFAQDFGQRGFQFRLDCVVCIC